MKPNLLITSFIVGLIASIAFIVIQPLFGMLTLTSRHAQAYIKLGEYGATSAIFIAWFVHISVSVFYAFIANVIFSFNRTWWVSVSQVIGLGWLTTLTATPANEFVVKLVTQLKIPELSSLSALNTDLGAKFWLHIVFFALVISGLILINKVKSKPQNSIYLNIV